jgi:hypothetical protein
VLVRHPPVLASLAHLRAKVYGGKLDYPAMRALMEDVSHSRLSDIHLAAFVTSCAGGRLDLDETVALTRAMVDVGERLDWAATPIMRRRPARKSHDLAGGADCGGMRCGHAQDLVARDHVAGGNGGHDGNLGAGIAEPEYDAPCRRA